MLFPKRTVLILLLPFLAGRNVPVLAGPGGALPDNDVMMKALVEELGRSMEKLVLPDLPRPYFIQYNVEDRVTFTLLSAYGGLLRSDESRVRVAGSRVRVGSSQLDNTNVGRGYGRQTSLPIDDDPIALRHAIWWTTDADYKQAVETLTRKEAYLKQKNVKDRPDDFSPADRVVAIEASAEIAFDPDLWKQNMKRLSARFKQYTGIQNSAVTFFAGAVNDWIVNSEGTRVRKADTGAYIEIRAKTQADDGMNLSDALTYLSLQTDQLPPMKQMLNDIDRLCTNLIALAHAPVLEHYTGPVLFEPSAAARVLESLLADKLCARPVPLGGETDSSLEKKIGLRILPRSFQVYDDPGPQTFEGVTLAGTYTYDDEGVKPHRVNLVENGILKTLLASRAPTRKIKKSTGHGRSTGYGDAQAHIGCLYVSDDAGQSPEELKRTLIQAARDEGLDFALRIASIKRGGYGQLGEPIMMYKVSVANGHEELIRGMEFRPVETRSLKHILAAGKERTVYNAVSGVSSSIIAPALLLEELDLNKIEAEFDRPPILKSPAQRKP